MEMKETLQINRIYNLDCLLGLKQLPDDFVDIAITSPPYWGQRGDLGIGSEDDPRDYVENLLLVLAETMRVLKPSGLLWLNLGDAYNTPINWKSDDFRYSTLGANGDGLDPSNSAYIKERGNRRAYVNKEIGWLKYGNLLALPWRIVVGLCDQGFLFRGEIIWAKRKVMPEGRCRRPHRKHESIFIIAKHEQHNFRTKPPVSSVWDLKPDPSVNKGHTSTFPLALPLACIDATDLSSGLVLDPFMGSGTSAVAAVKKELDYIGFELNTRNSEIAENRISGTVCQPALSLQV